MMNGAERYATSTDTLHHWLDTVGLLFESSRRMSEAQQAEFWQAVEITATPAGLLAEFTAERRVWPVAERGLFDGMPAAGETPTLFGEA